MIRLRVILLIGTLSACATDIPLGNLPEAGTTIPCGANQCGGGFRCCSACGLCAFITSDCGLICSLSGPDSGFRFDSGIRDSGLRDSGPDSIFLPTFPEAGPGDSGPPFSSDDSGSADARFDGASIDSSF